MYPAGRRSCDTLFPAAMSNGGYRTDSLIGIAEKFNWESTLRSPGRNRELDVRSMWDARRQLEGLEERTASAVAYLHRQLLDLQAEQSPKISSDVGVRLDALEQKQQQTAHRLDAMADVANSFAKQQEVQEQRLQALQERAINADAASQRVAGLLQELRRDVTEIFEDGRLSPRSLGGEELRSLVAEQRLSQLEVAVWSLQSMELPEVQLAVHAQDRRLADLETGPHGQDVLQAKHAPDFIVEEGGRTDEGRPCEPAEELRQSVAEKRVSQLEAALWHLQRELPEMQGALHSQDRRLLSLESRLEPVQAEAAQVSPGEVVEDALQDVADAGRIAVGAHEHGEAPSNAGEEAAGGHQSMRRVPASRSRDTVRGAEDGGGPTTGPMSRSSGPSALPALSGAETSAGAGGVGAPGLGGDGDAGSGEAGPAFGLLEAWAHAGPSADGAAGSAGAGAVESWPSWPSADGAAGSVERAERSSDRTEAFRAGDGAAGLAGERETDVHAPSRRPGPSGHLGSSGGGDGAAGRSGGSESEVGHVSQSLGGDGAAGGGRAREGDFGGGAPSLSLEAPNEALASPLQGHPMPDEADRAAAPPAGISQGQPRQIHEQESEEFSPDSASQDFEDVQPQSLDDALLSLVSHSGRGHDRQQSGEREGSVPEFDVSEAPSRSSSDSSCAREEAVT